MNLFRKRTASTPAAPGERRCRACGNGLADDQLACLECGAVDDAAAGGRERRWILPTSGVVAGALLLVTSASFAANTALNTGDPQAIKQKPPAVAQAPALPPAGGDGAVPGSAEDDAKGPDLGNLPAPSDGDPGGGAAPPADDAGDPADPGADADSGDDGGSSGDSGGSGGSSGGGSSGGGGSKPAKPDKPEEPAVTVTEWPDGDTGYTVVIYKFEEKKGAKAKASEIVRKGLPAGIIDSDKYESLTPGSWLVYIGRFDTEKEAERAAVKYENAGYPGQPEYVGQTEAPESDSNGSSSDEPQP